MCVYTKSCAFMGSSFPGEQNPQIQQKWKWQVGHSKWLQTSLFLLTFSLFITPGHFGFGHSLNSYGFYFAKVLRPSSPFEASYISQVNPEW